MPAPRVIKYQLHPLRETLYNELHIRLFHDLETPQQVTHLAAIAQQPELAKSFDLISDLCCRYGVNAPQAGAVVYHQDFGKFSIHWERHVEFYSLTIMQATPVATAPFVHTAIDLLPAD